MPQLLYPFILTGYLGCLRVLAVVNSAAVNIGVLVSLSILVCLVCMHSGGIAGSYGSSSTLAWKIPWMEEPGRL